MSHFYFLIWRSFTSCIGAYLLPDLAPYYFLPWCFAARYIINPIHAFYFKRNLFHLINESKVSAWVGDFGKIYQFWEHILILFFIRVIRVLSISFYRLLTLLLLNKNATLPTAIPPTLQKKSLQQTDLLGIKVCVSSSSAAIAIKTKIVMKQFFFLLLNESP